MNKIERLKKLKEKMLNDDNLPLSKGAKNLVFGAGNPESKILFIGEGPGYWEDQKGVPFVGNAGVFLNHLLTLVKLKREDVFITNVIHFRPPENRDPLPEEIEAFKPYLDSIIEIISPKVIVTLGRFSMAKFLPDARITAVHGKKFNAVWGRMNFTVVPMYHPAAGLRSLEIKRQTIDDFRKLGLILEEINSKNIVEKGKQMKLI